MNRGVRLLCVLCMFLPVTADAHGLGASYEQTIGDYWIDVGYDPPELFGGDRMVFDFNLAEAAATSTPIAYDYLWVRLYDDERTLLATGVARADIGPTTLLYALPHEVAGGITVALRFHTEEEVLAETEFTLPVAPYEDPRWWWSYGAITAAAVLGAALGAGVLFVYRRGVYNRVARE